MVFDYSKVPAKVTISGLEKSALPLFKTNLTSLVDGSLIINVKTSNELVYYTQLAKTLNASISSEEIKDTDSSSTTPKRSRKKPVVEETEATE